MKNLIIIGAGDFSLEIFSWLPEVKGYNIEWTFKGFLDDNLNALDNTFCKGPMLGTLDGYSLLPDDVFICAIANGNVKKKVEDIISGKGGKFMTLIHPSVKMLNDIVIGQGVVISPNCFISNSASIGNLSAINVCTSIGHNVMIGNYCQVSGNVDLTGHVKLGNNVFIGSSAVVIPGIKIGNDVTIGAGSVVIRNIKDNTTVFGNPAKAI